MPTPTRLLTGAALALLLTAGAAGCGTSGGSDNADGKPTTTTTDQATSTSPKTTTDVEVTTTPEPDSTTTTEDTTTTEAGSEPSGDGQAYVDALVSTIEGSSSDVFEPGQVKCLAGNFVDIIGVDALKSAGISPKEFAEGDGIAFPSELGVDEAKANKMFDQFEGCGIDLPELYSKIFSTGGDGLTDEQQSCVDQVLTEDNLRKSLVASFLGKDPQDDPLKAAVDCIGGVPSSENGVPATPSTVVPGN